LREHLLNALAGARLVRPLLEVVFRARGRALLDRLDRGPADRAQLRTLLGLVHQAQKTRFGRVHDFRRIRTVADFRRLVPLTTAEELWRGYWQPALPNLGGTTWPSLQAPLTVAPGPFLPLSPALQAAARAAWRTALALVAHARPRARLLSGQVVHLTDHPAGREHLPHLLRPCAQTGGTPEALYALAAAAAHADVTGILGPARLVVAFLDQVRKLRGEERLEAIWPRLTAVLYERRAPDCPADELRGALGPEVLPLEVLLRPEGPIAVVDVRQGEGGLRLLCEHGAYFEFVPAGQPGGPRLGLDEVQPGVAYELALTTPAGLWACRIGLTVCFSRLSPPTLRVLPAGAAVRGAASPPLAGRPSEARPPAPRPQRCGTPGALPESYGHSLWSIPVGPG
jgi:hypothetical protein